MFLEFLNSAMTNDFFLLRIVIMIQIAVSLAILHILHLGKWKSVVKRKMLFSMRSIQWSTFIIKHSKDRGIFSLSDLL